MSVLAVGTGLAVWAAPEIVGLYMRDTASNHEAFELTVTFARFLSPQIFFYGVFGMYGQILNNVVLISMFGCCLGFMTVPDRVQDITDTQVRLLGIGTTFGIAVQALALIPFARAAGFRLRPRFDWKGTGLGGSWGG